MYKDNGKLDVELLAEVGLIAHRIRDLDEKLALKQYKTTATGCCYPFTKIDNQITDASSSLTVSATTATAAIPPPRPHKKLSFQSIQIAQDITNKINETTATLPSSSSAEKITTTTTAATEIAARHYSNKQIEDIILEFYEKHLIYHQNQDKERFAELKKQSNYENRSKIYRLTSSDNHNMNDLPIESNKCNQTNTEIDHVDQLVDTVTDDNETATSATDPNAKCSTLVNSDAGKLSSSSCCSSNNNVKRNSIVNLQMPEIQISNSDDDISNPLTELEKTEFGLVSGGDGDGAAGTCSHYCGGWQSSICTTQLSDEDLRTLVIELKQKVEFTERMNWLCE